MTIRALLAAVLVVAAVAAAADATRVGSIVVAEAWARATVVPGGAGAAYLTLRNEGGVPDRLVEVETPVAGTARLHRHVTEGDVMRMRALDAVAVPSGGEVAMAPGGLHVMLTGVKAPLEEGAEFPLTLTFEKAGAVTVRVRVKAVGFTPPRGGQQGNGPHGHM